MQEVTITSIITVIGFVVSFLGVKRELKNSLRIKQNEFCMDKLYDMVEVIKESIEDTFKGIAQNNSSYISGGLDLISEKASYASLESIKIIEKIYMTARSWDEVADRYKSYNFYYISLMYLLLCQVRADMTGIAINPEHLLRIQFNEYDNEKDLFKIVINDTVKELRLSRKFIIK